MRKQTILRWAVLLLVFVALWYFYGKSGPVSTDPSLPSPDDPAADFRRVLDGDRAIADAFNEKRSGLMVESAGVVEKVLSDDLEGSRHQRFILRLGSDHTLLVSHNIDVASRIPLDEGDPLEFRGQYEWNERGGVVHWTHHDPVGRHPGGWIRHRGELYE